nr:hypothetical protein CFP56_08605 [Quercus suber]
MAEREELLGFGDVSTTGVAVPESEATTGGVVDAIARGDDVEVRLGELLLPLQDPWYCSSSLFPVVGAPQVSPLRVPKKWILKGEAPSHEAAWVLAASSILDLRFQGKELLPVPIQFLCPCGTTVGWSDWVEQEVADQGFCQGETMVTLKDVERICLLPIIGDVSSLELGLSDEEFVIAGKLLETFGGTSTSWGGNRARFSFWISKFREFKNVDTKSGLFSLVDEQVRNDELEGSPYHIIESSINVVLLQTFIWEHSKYYIDVGKDVGDGDQLGGWSCCPNGELQFLGFEDGLPLLMKWMGLKVWNLPSIALLDDGAHFP